MTCVCEDYNHCYVEEFLLEGASCLPEQAINYKEVKEEHDKKMKKD